MAGKTEVELIQELLEKDKYDKLMSTGMFFELYPYLSGDFEKDFVFLENKLSKMLDIGV